MVLQGQDKVKFQAKYKTKAETIKNKAKKEKK